MARIRQKFIKDTAKRIIVNYWDIVKEIWDKSNMLEDVNPEAAAKYRMEMYKKLVEKVTNVTSKKIRNRIAGYLITFMKQILYLGRYSLEELATRYILKEEAKAVEQVTGTSEAIEESEEESEGE